MTASRKRRENNGYSHVISKLKISWRKKPLEPMRLKGFRLVELSNNRAERSIKPFVIGRKNFIFASTPLGAQTSGVFYSLIETVKKTGLDPFRYLTRVLETAPTLDRTLEGWAVPLLRANTSVSCIAT